MSGIGTRDKRHERTMVSQKRTDAKTLWRSRLTGLMLSIAVSAASALSSTGTAAANQRTFSSPEQAADALAAAWRSGGKEELLAIFGPAGEKLVCSGDPVAERQARERLASSYDEGHRLETEGTRRVVLLLGKDEWPYPMPLVREGAGWRFDVKAGAEQIIDRRIGRNELNAIQVCRAYVEAQRDYAAKDGLGDGLHEYAQQVESSEGKHDGLYWRTSEGEEESPLGPLVAAAQAQGYGTASAEGQAPFHGYFYKILTRQGKNAPGGVRDYIVNGHLTGGFALVAFPAKYGDSGVMTFVVNQDGIVFEKNLGRNTAEIARHMTEYNPDKTWNIAP
ncbi:MAG TPA: DUF2950 domain-containing protein [Myxococcota bacterium]|nr:DUF2950 domain-containing protein [Myxococcota bacterium]